MHSIIFKCSSVSQWTLAYLTFSCTRVNSRKLATPRDTRRKSLGLAIASHPHCLPCQALPYQFDATPFFHQTAWLIADFKSSRRHSPFSLSSSFHHLASDRDSAILESSLLKCYPPAASSNATWTTNSPHIIIRLQPQPPHRHAGSGPRYSPSLP